MPKPFPKKATKIREVSQATAFNEPVYPRHPFFVDFGNYRGDFDDAGIYSSLNAFPNEKGEYEFDYSLNSFNKVLLFLGGMRGSGKSSELAKYAQVLNTSKCFFVVTCNIDTELNANNLDYIDVVLLQLEKLAIRLRDEGVQPDSPFFKGMKKWLEEKDVDFSKKSNFKIKSDANLEVGTGSLLEMIGLAAKFKLGVMGDKSQAELVRQLFRNNFNDFAREFNLFLEEVNAHLRKIEKGREILFIIDGLEKTNSADVRKKMVIDDSYQIEQIKAYTLFTLPLELFRERKKLLNFAEVKIFPFVKVKEKNDSIVQKSLEIFKQFIEKRVASDLFESEELKEQFILFSGGSPRQLLRLIKAAALNTKNGEVITKEVFEDTLRRQSADDAHYLTGEMLKMLKVIHDANKEGKEVSFNDVLQDLLENNYVMEYNAGTYTRVNPLIEISPLYRQEVTL